MLTFPILPMTGPVVLEALRGFSGSTCSPTTTPRDLGTRPPRAQPGAAIAFLIAGPLTTVPAMVAVWGVVSPACSPSTSASGWSGPSYSDSRRTSCCEARAIRLIRLDPKAGSPRKRDLLSRRPR